ncbi:MAG: DUF1963 domain-containing protein [Planctomycetota bacterium]
MFKQQIGSIHARFDIAEAKKTFGRLDSPLALSGEFITSPFDLFSVESLRDSLMLRAGDGVPVDVFVFGKGEPLDPRCTKVGGKPYWPVGKPWPRDNNGTPLLFVAQFCFADSLDVFDRELPGTILSLLTARADAWMWPDGDLRFHWHTGDEPNAELNGILSATGDAGPFFGSIYRTCDYPAAIELALDQEVPRSYLLAALEGTKMGGVPRFIQQEFSVKPNHLCQLGSIQAHPNVPYPWVNQSDPLGLSFNEKGIYGDQNCAVLGDMGSVYMELGSDGNVTRSFECY